MIINDRTLGKILEDKARKNRGKPLIYFEDSAVSYEELSERANRIARGFLNMGISKGTKVCIMLPNCSDFIHILCGLSEIGAVAVLLNTAHRGVILQHMINLSDAAVIVADKRYLDSIKLIENELGNVTTLIVHPDKKEDIPKLHFDTYSYQELLEKPAQLSPVDIKFSDPLLMTFTSGTTGLSKGMVWPHNQLIWMAEQWVRGMRVTPNDIYYSWTPLFHLIGLGWFMTALLADATIAIVERFSLSRFWDEIRRNKANLTSLLPMAMELLYRQPEKGDDSANSLRAVMAGPIPKRIHRAFEKRFGVALVNDYGLAEFDPISLSDYGDTRVGSCGKGQEDVEVKIFDEDDNEVPSNVVGELVVRPLKSYIMATEYYKMPEKTVEAWRNLWFHTGDLAYKDEDGFIYFVDRKKEAIRRRGENISSMELEHIISTHPDIAECAAVAVPAELGEDDIKVVIRLKEGAMLSPEELLQFCEDRMAFFMVPRYVEFAKDFLRTETLRIKKDELKGVTNRTWDREQAGYKLRGR